MNYSGIGKRGKYEAKPDDGDCETVTVYPSEIGKFKEPTLRNIAKTAPYFHNGSAKTLDQAINIMGLNQLGREIPAQNREKIAAFLQSLSGELKTTPMDPPKQ
jgi:cytochrome c peroxidase